MPFRKLAGLFEREFGISGDFEQDPFRHKSLQQVQRCLLLPSDAQPLLAWQRPFLVERSMANGIRHLETMQRKKEHGGSANAPVKTDCLRGAGFRREEFHQEARVRIHSHRLPSRIACESVMRPAFFWSTPSRSS